MICALGNAWAVVSWICVWRGLSWLGFGLMKESSAQAVGPGLRWAPIVFGRRFFL